MIKRNKFLNAFIILSFLSLLISCKSKDERIIISEIKKNGFVDLSVCCKDFDEIIIYDEGYYHDFHKDEWLGPKIYYFLDGKIEKVINLRCCADIPYGNFIVFYPFSNGKILLNRKDTIFYLTQIEEYKTGKILKLEKQKKDIQILSVK